jgi:hypothetical protein
MARYAASGRESLHRYNDKNVDNGLSSYSMVFGRALSFVYMLD